MQDKIAGIIETNCPFVEQWDTSECAAKIIEALPDMVQPLVWEESEGGFWAEDFRIYNLEHPRRDVWRLIQADFGTQYRSDFGGKHGYEQAMSLANLIRTRRILSAFGITGET